MLAELWLPIVVSAVALFFASFLSWVVAPIHRKDWVKLDREDEFLNVVGGSGRVDRQKAVER